MKNKLLLALVFLIGTSAQAIDYSVGTTSESITMKQNVKSVLVVNDHATQSVFVNFYGGVASNSTGTTATTTAESKVLDFGTDAATLGVVVGDFIELTEGDGNDGVYSIDAVNGDEVVLAKALTVTHSGTQNYQLQHAEIKAGENLAYQGATKKISLIASGAATTVRIIAQY